MIDSYHSVYPDALKTQIGLLEKYYQENSEDKNPEETVVKVYKGLVTSTMPIRYTLRRWHILTTWISWKFTPRDWNF